MLPGLRTQWQKMCCMEDKGTGYHCWDSEPPGISWGVAGVGEGPSCVGCFTQGRGDLPGLCKCLL